MGAVLEQLFAGTDAGVVVVDGEHRILAWNPGTQHLLGWSEAEALGHDIADLLAPEGSSLRRYVGAALLGDVVQAVPVRLRSKSGAVVELLVTCRGVRLGGDEGPTALLIIDEVPRHQTVAATLAQRTRELQAILGAFPDMFFWADADGRVLDYHAGTEVDLARPLHGLLGHRLADLVEPDVGRRLQAAASTALAEHRKAAVEFTLREGRGVGHYEARIVPIAPDRVVGVIRNLTELRQLEEQVHRSQKMEAIGRLAAGVTHDFNNLLTVVGGSIVFLRQELAGNETGMELLDEITAAADKATLLLRQLLLFGRREPASPRALDLNALVRDNEGLLARLMREDIALTVQLDPEPQWVFADPVKLEQVLYNLCTNARDAMPRGGRLTVRTEPRIGARGGDRRMVALVVTDTGIGMDADTLERVFEPFFTTRGERGTGLGLATVHSIVRQAGGRIEVSSALGEGATFTVLLPSGTAGTAAPPHEAAGRPPVARGSETVLVVEDDAQVRQVLARELRHQGYRTLEAVGAEEALHIYLANQHAIRLVVSDVVMPDFGGVQLAEELHRRAPRLPIVLISGYERDGVELPEGTIWLQKPLAFDEFLRVVRAALDAAATAGAGAGPTAP